MLERAGKPAFHQRIVWLLIALAFAASAVAQAIVASSMAEWWPVVVAAVLAILAVLSGLVAARRWDDSRRRHLQ
ncbi:hypothetical protein [Qaidamihabitans albus]|uniref:hypothetical protein n=1 Tax=Qaidamihabitans albus TaxID=2795733 RepID=UPI0018F1D8FB|nr:hypothetical protein [Qaidamihabitans albus]